MRCTAKRRARLNFARGAQEGYNDEDTHVAHAADLLALLRYKEAFHGTDVTIFVDNAPVHTSMEKGAIRVENICKGDNQPSQKDMKPGFTYDLVTGERVPFLFQRGDWKLGAESICRERGLPTAGKVLGDLLDMLKVQPDFLECRTKLEALVDEFNARPPAERGDIHVSVMYLPKYSPEMNPM